MPVETKTGTLTDDQGFEFEPRPMAEVSKQYNVKHANRLEKIAERIARVSAEAKK